jgi:hypothetical protein
MNFKDRFIASLPEIPADLDLHLDEFVVFDPNLIPRSLTKEESDLLTRQGLPRDASPFLSFHAYSRNEIESRKEIFGIPEFCFPIGHNGSGDVLVIDMNNQEIIYFNHDNYNERVFINSSILQFAESLCIYQEHRTKRTMVNFLDAIASIDSKASNPGTMWQAEANME